MMIEFDAMMLQFAQQGEKTGWTYIEVPADLADLLSPGNKKSFRVKGKLDAFFIEGAALLPMGDGNFILAVNARMRKGVHKNKGAMLHVRLEKDEEFKVEFPAELRQCLEEDTEAFAHFRSMAPSHQGYYFKWINEAKTMETRTRRIADTLMAMSNKMNYGQMIRFLKKQRQER